ncbi:MAG: CARDB domain-containing protein [Elusimicrobiota bacterium]|jgi:hypothetical protein
MEKHGRKGMVWLVVCLALGLVLPNIVDAQTPPAPVPGIPQVKKPLGKPDLRIGAVKTRWKKCGPAYIPFDLVVEVENIGTAPSPHIPGDKGVRGQDTHPDGGWLNGTALPPIPAGGHRKVTLSFSPHTGHMLERAPHPWQVRVDPDGLVNELNEGNNEKVVNITVPSKVCPKVRARPDLIINSFKLKDTGPCAPGTTPMWTFEVAVKNRGTVPAGPSVVKVKDTHGGIDWANGAAIPALPAGGIATAVVPIYYVAGIAHHIKFEGPHYFGPVADANHAVDEYDELNNSPGTAVVGVTPTGCP